MDTLTSIKNVQVRLTADEHRRLKELAGDRNLQVYLRTLITGAIEEEPRRASPYREKNDEWHEKLELVLERGSERDVIGIQQNLEWAAVSIKAGRAARRVGGK